MMALNPGTTGDSSPAAMMTPPSSSSTKPMRRRRSKGTIAGFASGKQPTDENAKDVGDSSSQSTASVLPQHSLAESSLAMSSSALSSSTPPCHSARLALMALQNSSRMGARTQLNLCPPGRARRSLQSASRTTRKQHRHHRRVPSRSMSTRSESELGGYYGLDKMIGKKQLDDYEDQEEDFLLANDTFDVDSEEEASSGDEDEIWNIEELLHAEDGAPALDDEKKYEGLREPLFTPALVNVNPVVVNQTGAPMIITAMAGKLPFNYRKIKYFDSVTATERAAARSYLRAEARKCKKREGILLSRHLKRIQRRERRRIQLEKGQEPDEFGDDIDPKEEALLTGGVSQFPHPMTPAASAALLLESLSLNPVESVEGMGKCYDGIVAAGVALLESQAASSASPLNEEEQKAGPSRSEIMAALAPLLITSLEPASGEVILALANLRRQCATPRYQRRFVQRVAPSLIRPPRGAMWCLRHQHDMEPILAAAELIFDSAPDVFSKGWHERGRYLLADSKREKTLSAAAEQLKNLSSVEHGLGLGHGGGHWRNHKQLMVGATPKKESASNSNDALAEWEVIAVDRQIRVSISNIMKRDWARVVLKAIDTDVTRATRRSTPASRNRPAAIQTSGPEASPKSSLQPPRSPTRIKAPLSPTRPTGSASSSPVPENLESVFGPSFSTQPASAVVAAAPSLSPTEMDADEPPSLTPLSPPVPRRPALDTDDSSETKSPFTSPPHTPKHQLSNPPPPMLDSHTPPRSPIAASKSIPMQKAISSPMRNTTKPSQLESSVALSPSAASIGSATSEAVPFRASSNVSSSGSVGSVTSQTSNYRMLTSTAAERKRTVAACRALRAQISRFEEAFIQLHGRPPKGAAERAPLATTYAQYREWKRAIRADAACRIQAMFRGKRTRSILLRTTSNPLMSRVILKGAGRSGVHLDRKSRGTKENVLSELSIPVEIGGDDTDAARLSPMPGAIPPPTPGSTAPFNDVGVEVYIGPSQAGGAQSTGLAPHWSSSLPKRRPSAEPFPGPRSGSPPQFPSPTGFGSGAPSPAVVSELNSMTLAELQARKRDLKQQLKQYDMIFARKHRRMPVKAEKEPIRHLYEHYNALKNQITNMEQEAKHQPQTPGLSSAPAMTTQRTPSPPSNVVATITDSSGEDSVGNPPTSRARRKASKSPVFDAPAAAAASTPTGAPSQDLSALKAEKTKLHQMLRSYEKDFFKEHKRQVSSFADIKPVASQYRRYKEIKKAIASLQQEK